MAEGSTVQPDTFAEMRLHFLQMLEIFCWQTDDLTQSPRRQRRPRKEQKSHYLPFLAESFVVIARDLCGLKRNYSSLLSSRHSYRPQSRAYEYLFLQRRVGLGC